MKWYLVFALLLVGAFAFNLNDDSCDSSLESSSSDSSDEDHHHHHHHHHKPTPTTPHIRPKCEQDWYTLYRPQGIWCLRVGIGKMDYAGAIAQCATYGGVLSGVQNEYERNLIANESNRQTLAYNIKCSGVWLGAQRNLQTNTFYWTDGHTTGTEGFKWGNNEPDNSLYIYGPQNCVQLIAWSPGYTGKWSTFQSGDMDDYWCGRNDDPDTRMYACGKAGPPE